MDKLSTAIGSNVSELTLENLLSNKLTDTVCVNLNQERESWVAFLVCSEYMESMVDSIIIRDEKFRPVGIVGGYDLLDHLRKNPRRDSQYQIRVKDIMLKNPLQVEKTTKFKDLMKSWVDSNRAFAIIINEFGDCSSVSARKMIQVGTKCKSDNVSISSMPKKKIVTFKRDDSLGKVLDLMFKNKTRKLILENSNQFISDRLILGEISKILKFQPSVEYFLDIPINQFKLENVTVIGEDIKFNQLCSVMENMDHPYVTYKDTVISPWDVCLTLMREDVIIPPSGYKEKRTCPHCGKEIG